MNLGSLLDERPRRNRVTPFGVLEAVPARGTLMGNRGCLHGRDGAIGPRPFRHRAWITCELEFRGRRRTIDAPGRYTPLFFADEATALAAGHRPCAECRRTRYSLFKAAWRKAHGLGPLAALSAADIDRELHEGRIDGAGPQRTHTARLGDLPGGTFVAIPAASGRALLFWGGLLHSWSHHGYADGWPADPDQIVIVLTPKPIVRVLTAGYVPATAS